MTIKYKVIQKTLTAINFSINLFFIFIFINDSLCVLIPPPPHLFFLLLFILTVYTMLIINK